MNIRGSLLQNNPVKNSGQEKALSGIFGVLLFFKILVLEESSSVRLL